MKKIIFSALLHVGIFSIAQQQNVDFTLEHIDYSGDAYIEHMKYDTDFVYFNAPYKGIYKADRLSHTLQKMAPDSSLLRNDYLFVQGGNLYRINYTTIEKIQANGAVETVYNVGRNTNLGRHRGEMYFKLNRENNVYAYGKLGDNGFQEFFTTETDFVNSHFHNDLLILQASNKFIVYNLETNVIKEIPLENRLYIQSFNGSYNFPIFNNKLYFTVEDGNSGTRSYSLDLVTDEIATNSIIPNIQNKIIENNGIGIIKHRINEFKILNSDGTISILPIPYNLEHDYFYTHHYLTEDYVVFFTGGNGLKYFALNVHTREIVPLPSVNHIYPNDLRVSNNKIYYDKNGSMYVLDLDTEEVQLFHPELKVQKVFEMKDGELFLHASLPDTGEELYSIDSFTNTLNFYGNVNYGPGVMPSAIFKLENQTLVFGGDKIFTTQGNVGTTSKLNTDFYYSNYFSNIEYNDPKKQARIGNEIFFGCNTTANNVRNLCKLNTDTLDITNISDNESNEINVVKFLAKLNDKLLFVGKIGYNREQLWVTDGTPNGTIKLTNLPYNVNLFWFDQDPQHLVTNGKFYFDYALDFNTKQIWSTDGTIEGTQMIHQQFIRNSQAPMDLLMARGNNLIYFKGDTERTSSGSLASLFNLDLETLNETRLAKLLDGVTHDHEYSDRINGDEIFFPEESTAWLSRDYSKINANTLEKTLLNRSMFIYSDTKVVKYCDDYLLMRNYYDYDFFVMNKQTNRILRTPQDYDDYRNTAVCVNGRLLFSATSETMGSHFLSLENDTFIHHPVTIEGQRTAKHLEIIFYDEENQKIYSRVRDHVVDYENELLVTDFYLPRFGLNTSEVEENNKNSIILIYPNPATNDLYISTESAEILSYGIYDLTGKLMKTELSKNQSDIKIDIKDLPKGIYIINVNTTKGKESKKLIIK